MQITVDISRLDQDQREHLAGFILAFPARKALNFIPPVFESEESRAAANERADNFLDSLADPKAAFGAENIDPTAVFGIQTNHASVDSISVQPSAGNVSTLGPHLVIPQADPLPPPPAPNVPSGTAPPSGGQAGTAITLDSAGLPWDERIHASSKAQSADKTWRKKRGVSADLVTSVEAELRKLMAIPSPAAVPSSVQIPPPPSVTAVPAPPAPDQGDLLNQYIALVQRASAALSAGKISENELTSTCAFAGVGALPLLTKRLDLVPQVAAAIDAIIAKKG